MFESPITQIVSGMTVEYENGVLKAVQRVGFDVNKEELTKALLYDRGQYEKGYEDGLNASKWVPCSERLPEDYTECLICDDIGRVYESKYYRSAWLIKNGTSVVVAWMPLPKPYIPEGE